MTGAWPVDFPRQVEDAVPGTLAQAGECPVEGDPGLAEPRRSLKEDHGPPLAEEAQGVHRLGLAFAPVLEGSPVFQAAQAMKGLGARLEETGEGLHLLPEPALRLLLGERKGLHHAVVDRDQNEFRVPAPDGRVLWQERHEAAIGGQLPPVIGEAFHRLHPLQGQKTTNGLDLADGSDARRLDQPLVHPALEFDGPPGEVPDRLDRHLEGNASSPRRGGAVPHGLVPALAHRRPPATGPAGAAVRWPDSKGGPLGDTQGGPPLLKLDPHLGSEPSRVRPGRSPPGRGHPGAGVECRQLK